MSPAHARATDAQIVDAARNLIRQHGVDAMTLVGVADAVGIRAPSLYKHFASRDDLLRAVKDGVLADLQQGLERASQAGTSHEVMSAMAGVYRARAVAEPELYRLTQIPRLKTPSQEAEYRAVAPALRVMEGLVGPDNALNAARCFTSFLHGFVTMEIDGNFGFGGSVDEAFEYAVLTLMKGVLPAA